MKYLGLAYYTPAAFTTMPPADRQALVGQCPPKDAALKATHQLRVSASLGGPDAVIKIRPQGGKAKVTDGPFAETKEMVGGFFIIEAADRDEAVRLASIHPAATLGEQVGWYIELHPIGFFEQYNAEGVVQA